MKPKTTRGQGRSDNSKKRGGKYILNLDAQKFDEVSNVFYCERISYDEAKRLGMLVNVEKGFASTLARRYLRYGKTGTIQLPINVDRITITQGIEVGDRDDDTDEESEHLKFANEANI